MNKVILMGRLTKDPELRYTPESDPTAVCRYSLAVNRSYKRDGELDVDFIDIVAFGNRGEFAEKYFRKGQMVGVVGELRINSYEDKAGNKRWSTSVIVSEQYFGGGKSEGRQDEDSRGYGGFPPAPKNKQFVETQDAPPNKWTDPIQQGLGDELDDDLPF